MGRLWRHSCPCNPGAAAACSLGSSPSRTCCVWLGGIWGWAIRACCSTCSCARRRHSSSLACQQQQPRQASGTPAGAQFQPARSVHGELRERCGPSPSLFAEGLPSLSLLICAAASKAHPPARCTCLSAVWLSALQDIFYPEFEQIRATGILPTGQPVPLHAFPPSYGSAGSSARPATAGANPYATYSVSAAAAQQQHQQQAYGGYGTAAGGHPTIAIPPAPLQPGGYGGGGYGGTSPSPAQGRPGMPSPGYSASSGYSPAGSAISPAGEQRQREIASCRWQPLGACGAWADGNLLCLAHQTYRLRCVTLYILPLQHALSASCACRQRLLLGPVSACCQWRRVRLPRPRRQQQLRQPGLCWRAAQQRRLPVRADDAAGVCSPHACGGCGACPPPGRPLPQ